MNYNQDDFVETPSGEFRDIPASNPMATDALSDDSLQALPLELRPNVDHLVTEDDTPVDNIFSEKQQRLLTETLYASWTGPGPDRPFVAMSNVGLFFHVRKPPLVPDALLSLDVELPSEIHLKQNRSYFVWEYGKPPDVVIEVVSNREGGEGTTKLTRYASIGVRYYVIYDPDGMLSAEPLQVFRLEALSTTGSANQSGSPTSGWACAFGKDNTKTWTPTGCGGSTPAGAFPANRTRSERDRRD